MCGRYRRTTKEEELARIYNIPIPKQPDLPVSYNIAPSQEILAIRFNPETGERCRSDDNLAGRDTITLPDRLTSPPGSCRKPAQKADLGPIPCRSTRLGTIKLPRCLVANLQPRRRLQVTPWAVWYDGYARTERCLLGRKGR